LDEWYNVSPKIIELNGGKGWISRYNGSLIKALKDIYPNHEWKERTSYKHLPWGYWESPENRLRFVKQIEQEFSILYTNFCD
jgi:hypothetical protein